MNHTDRGRRRRSGRTAVAVLVVGTSLATGIVGVLSGHYWWNPSASISPADRPSAGQKQAYTCGMHTEVIQYEPGDCPICQMKLTPIKSGDEPETGQESVERRVLYWRAPMDPNFVSDQPGKSPMGMDLVPVYAEQTAGSSHTIRIDPVTRQNMGLRTTVVRRGPLAKTIRTVGRVDYDERGVTFVDTKYDGWIRKLHVAETGQFVKEGQPLFDVFSFELIDAQTEFLEAVRSVSRMEKSTLPGTKESANRMVEATRTRLAYLDVSEEQIQHLAETGQVAENLTLYSPASGIVSEKMALEGMAVKPGMRLYTIADLSRVWVYVDIYEYQFPWVKLGQEARMTLPYTPGREFVGQVDYIYPTLDPRTRVNKVRLQFENPTLQLKPGMFANITLTSRLKRDALLIPREAYIDSGIRQVAFVDLGEGRFSPREIMAGVQAEDGMVEVLYGLDEGEIVVSSGQFLLDSEAKMQEAIAKMKPVVQIEPSGKDDHEHKGGAEQIPEGAKYSCPMDTHPDEENSEERGAYFSEEPGSCGICGMTLKPFEELDWVQALYAAGEADVRYTCVDHPHVLKFGTGDCPRCDKTLAPFKLMYTCPDPAHSGENSLHSGGCPTCGRTLAPYRGVWLDQSMAEKNVPPNPGVAEASAYRCPLHPLVHSDREGSCTICGAQLRSVTTMETQPLGGVANKGANYTCPMHPATVNAMSPGLCPVCGMQLVSQEVVRQREASSEHVALQMDNVMEHYLEIQKRLASDAKGGIALHALGLASAANELARHAADSEEEFSPEVTAAANRLHRAALKTGGINIQSDRVAFVELSEAVRTLVNYARPARTRWPKLYIYHCPISKGDWLQVGEEKTNPYYGFKMLDCGDLVEIK